MSTPINKIRHVPSSLGAETRNILHANGVHPRKALGQNFLIDRAVLDTVVEAADLQRGETVLEVGPGIGTLTLALAAGGALVNAVELDEQLARVLRARMVGHKAIRIVQSNILHMNLQDILPAEQPFKLVANIPYYITAPLLRLFLEGPWRPELIVLMVQREVAERLTAQPGRLSILGISTQFYAQADIVCIVPPEAFLPPPDVHSAIVRLRPLATPPVSVDDPERFFTLVRCGFGEKRKQLHNALMHGLAHIPARDLDDALQQAGIDRTSRAEALSLEEWGRLYSVLASRLPPTPSPAMKMIVGLGNPGIQYVATRHNVGFMTIDELVRRHGAQSSSARMSAWSARTHITEFEVLLVKPQTFMNLSGEAVGRLWRWHKLALDDILIISDDIDLPFGRLRLRERGSAGGHNGLRSVFSHLGSQDIARLKIGVGRPTLQGTRDHVLSSFGADEIDVASQLIARAADAVELVLRNGVSAAMNMINAEIMPDKPAMEAEA